MSVETAPETKPIYLSRTFWLNIGAIAVVILQVVLDEAIIPPAYQGIGLTVLNILLRFVTTKSVTIQ